MPTTVVTRESSVEIEILIDEEGFTQALKQAASLRGFRTQPQYRPITHQRSITMKKSDLLARELNKALAEEARIEEKYGTDHEDGTVIAFRVQFAPSGIWYEYAAIRVSGAWFTTGPRTPKAYTWEELTGWFDEAHRVSKIKVLREGHKNKKGA